MTNMTKDSQSHRPDTCERCGFPNDSVGEDDYETLCSACAWEQACADMNREDR